MLAGVFDFHDKKARDVMRPRTEIVALSDDATEDEVWQTVRKERYSRYPVYRESLDDVVGVFLAKDLWLHPDGKPFAIHITVEGEARPVMTRAGAMIVQQWRQFGIEDRTRSHFIPIVILGVDPENGGHRQAADHVYRDGDDRGN